MQKKHCKRKERLIIEGELVLLQGHPTRADQNPRSLGYFAKGSLCRDASKVKQ
jgi:hypothetical protein